MKRSIQINSLNRQKIGNNTPQDFMIKFTPSLKLSQEMKHELAMDRLTMIYSWHNINEQYGKKKIIYSPNKGKIWTEIEFHNGNYSYNDINNYIQESLKENGHDKNGIKITFILSTYKVVIELKDNYWVDQRGSEFNKLLGFDKNIVKQT